MVECLYSMSEITDNPLAGKDKNLKENRSRKGSSSHNEIKYSFYYLLLTHKIIATKYNVSSLYLTLHGMSYLEHSTMVHAIMYLLTYVCAWLGLCAPYT